MNKTERLHDSITDGFARADIVAEDAAADNSDLQIQLLVDPKRRNRDIWIDGFVDAGLPSDQWDVTLMEMNLVPEADRSPDYDTMLAQMFACAEADADSRGLIEALWGAGEKGALQMIAASNKMNQTELEEAATGPTKQAFKDAKTRRRDRAGQQN